MADFPQTQDRESEVVHATGCGAFVDPKRPLGRDTEFRDGGV